MMEATLGPVLVLDDNEGNRLLLEVSLETGGFDVHTAKTGKEALALATRYPFVVALIDVNLPDIDGIEIARQLRALSQSLILVMVTVNDDDETIHRAQEADCDVFMTKPFDLDKLLDFMQSLDVVKLRERSEIVIVDNLQGHQFRR